MKCISEVLMWMELSPERNYLQWDGMARGGWNGRSREVTQLWGRGSQQSGSARLLPEELIWSQAISASDWSARITWPQHWPLIGRARALPAAGKQFNSAWPCNHIIYTWPWAWAIPSPRPWLDLHSQQQPFWGTFPPFVANVSLTQRRKMGLFAICLKRR